MSHMEICLQEVINKQKSKKQEFASFGLEEIAIKMTKTAHIYMK